MARVLTAINSRGVTMALNFTLPSTSLFAGPNETVWGADGTANATFSFARLNAGTKLDLLFYKTMRTQTVAYGAGCVTGAYCCVDSQSVARWFALTPLPGSKEYHVFSPQESTQVWDFPVVITVGNKSWDILLSDEVLTASWPPHAGKKRSEENFGRLEREERNDQNWRERRETVIFRDSTFDHLEESGTNEGFLERRSLEEYYNTTRPLISVQVIPLSSTAPLSATTNFVVVDPTWANAPFYISTEPILGNQARSPGLSQATFSQMMTGYCSLDRARSITQLKDASGNVIDAFTPYWRAVVAPQPQSAVSITTSQLDPRSAPSNWMVILRNDVTTLLVDSLIDSSEYTVVPVWAEPKVVGGNFLIVLPNSAPALAPPTAPSAPTGEQYFSPTAFNVFVDIANTGRTAGGVRVQATKCCYSAIDEQGKLIATPGSGGGLEVVMTCASLFSTQPQIQTINSGQAQRFFFSYAELPYGQSGYCSFNVSAVKLPADAPIVYDVGFSLLPLSTFAPNWSPSSTTPSAPVSSPSDGLEGADCNPPFVRLPVFPYCQSPCTIDQTWLNVSIQPPSSSPNAPNSPPNTAPTSYQDVLYPSPSGVGACKPVDCAAKYAGNRNYYDENSGLCKPRGSVPSTPQPLPQPEEPVSTSPIDETPAPLYTSPSVPQFISPSFVLQPDGTYVIDCGPHGTFDASASSCNCDAGWITDLQQPIWSFQYCSKQGKADPNTVYDQAKPPSSKNVNYLVLIICLAILAVLIVLGVCVGCVVRKCVKGKKSGKRKASVVVTTTNSNTIPSKKVSSSPKEVSPHRRAAPASAEPVVNNSAFISHSADPIEVVAEPLPPPVMAPPANVANHPPAREPEPSPRRSKKKSKKRNDNEVTLDDINAYAQQQQDGPA